MQKEGRPPQAAESQQVRAQCKQQVAQKEGGPGVLWHSVGEGCAQVHGGAHV